MEDNVLVSVIIPFYSKSQSRLKECVLSALSQTVKDIEVLVIDDCSPVRAVDELSSVADPRLKLHRLEKNMNGAAARNEGVKKAQGKYIAFLDSDDVWLDNKLQVCLDLCKSDNDVIYSKLNYKILGKGIIDSRPSRGKLADERVADYIFLNNGLIQTSTIFLSKKLAMKCLFNESYVRHQDYDLCFKLERHKANFRFVDEPLADWIHQSGNSTVSKGATSLFMLQWLEENEENFTLKSKDFYLCKSLIPAAIECRNYGHIWKCITLLQGSKLTLLTPAFLIRFGKSFIKSILK